MDKQFYTVPEVAKLFGVSEATVRRWIKAKKLRGTKIGGKYAHWRIPQSEIDRLLFRNKETTKTRKGKKR